MSSSPLPITDIARSAGFLEGEVEPYGRWKAKIRLEVEARVADRPLGKYVDVTAITPTPFGEGKTVTTIGLAEAFHAMGRKSIACLRQPSMGPTFGLKGGAAGGGAATIVPTQEMNLHLTGDIHAVAAAHNLLAAAVDSHVWQGNALQIDPATIQLKRVVDMEDRALREIRISVGSKREGADRATGFDIAVASEVMALLALAADRDDLRARLSRIVVAFNKQGAPVTAGDLKAAGAMAALLNDAIMPTLMQTAEGSPVLVHAGPFANIAHGNSSIIADRIALRMADVVITESGFGSDLGMEKFMDIKCRTSGLVPDCVVVVATVRALKMHGADVKVSPRGTIPADLLKEDLEAVERGCANLAKHVGNVGAFGIPAVVAINRFPEDTDAEIALVKRKAREAGAVDACISTVFRDGGNGGVELAQAVEKACALPKHFRMLYPDHLSIVQKIDRIAQTMYGASGVEFSDAAKARIEQFNALGWGELPVCMAKTHRSLSHDATLRNAPTGFTLPVRDLRASIGAGFLYALCGDILTMPGMPAVPGFEHIDVVDGEIVGL